MNRKLLITALGLTGMLAASSASAVMVESFDYTLNGGWVEGSAVCASGADCVTYDGATTDVQGVTTRSHISWGTEINDNGQSSLTVWQNDGDNTEPLGDTTGDGTVLTNGTPRIGTIFEHDNVTIENDGNRLESVEFREEFTLTGSDPAVDGLPVESTLVLQSVLFNETPNDADPCPAGDDQPCNDIFVLLNEEELIQDVEVCDGDECWTYRFTIFQEDLMTVSTDDLLADFGVELTDDQALFANGSVGVLVTPEFRDNMFEFQFRTEHIPEPGTLALLGLGLGGVGFGRWRRKAA
ncbi:MAG: hypothetical protein Kow0060_09550 [Methylohalobius crimeensis]